MKVVIGKDPASGNVWLLPKDSNESRVECFESFKKNRKEQSKLFKTYESSITFEIAASANDI